MTLTITDNSEVNTTVPDVIEDSRAFANNAIVAADLVPRFNGPNSAKRLRHVAVAGRRDLRRAPIGRDVQLSDKIAP